MEHEKRLIPCGDMVTLGELPPGTIFAFGDDCIAVKSEYRCNNGLIEAFIIESGELFWGGVHTTEEQNALMVQPLEIEEVDAVEVVRCKDCKYAVVDSLVEEHKLVCTKSVNWRAVEQGHFCSYGERREGE